LWQQIGGYAVAVVVALIGGGLLWAYLATEVQNRRRRLLIGSALLVLVVTDMWLFSLKFVRLEAKAPSAMWLEAREVIGETNERVLPWGVSIFEQNGPLLVGLNSVFGYDSLEPANHITLASSVPDPRSSAYDVLGARYVIAPNQLDQYGDGQRPLRLVAETGAAWIYERARWLPVARLAYDAEVVADDGAAVARVHDPDFDPQTTAILDEEAPCELGVGSAEDGRATIMAAEPGAWWVRTESSLPALLILAETDYPGWRVAIDGEEARGLRAYTTLRAVCVPAGTHDVTWTYVPTIYVAGAGITLVALIVLVLALLRWRQNKE
jgi:hypothetical protein